MPKPKRQSKKRPPPRSVKESSSRPAKRPELKQNPTMEEKKSPEPQQVEQGDAEVDKELLELDQGAQLPEKLTVLHNPQEQENRLALHRPEVFLEAHYWAPCNWEGVRERFPRVTSLPNGWARVYVIEDHWYLNHLTQSQKQTIIKSLEGFCVQDLDWDTLMDSLPWRFRYNAATGFIQMLILKDIYSKIVAKPFWFLDGKSGPEDQQGNKDFAEQLNYLYERTKSVSTEGAANWRSELYRLCIVPVGGIGSGEETLRLLGSYHRPRKEEVLAQFASDLIASEPLRWLLRPLETPEQEKKRHLELLQVYRDTEKVAVLLHAGRFEWDFLWVDDLPAFGHRDEKTMPYHFHHLERDEDGDVIDGRVDGKRILMIYNPVLQFLERSIVRTYDTFAVCPALAVMEDPLVDAKEQAIVEAQIKKKIERLAHARKAKEEAAASRS